MLRIIPTAAHNLEHVERTINAFSIIAKSLKDGKYNAEEVTLNL
jgi:glycine C-acetyltransferase